MQAADVDEFADDDSLNMMHIQTPTPTDPNH